MKIGHCSQVSGVSVQVSGFSTFETSCETTSLCRKIEGAPIVLVLDKILIPEDEHEHEDEDEDEKYQIKSNAYALRPQAYTM